MRDRDGADAPATGPASGAPREGPATEGDASPGAEGLCDYLRAKVSAGAHGDKRALLRVAADASSIYWCLLTMSPAGPDDGFVHASSCSKARQCCVADTDPPVS